MGDWRFTTVDFDTGHPEFNKAYEWFVKEQGFLKSLVKFNNKEEFIEALTEDLCFIGYDHGICKGIVYGERKTNSVVEGHLFCSKFADADFLAALISYAKVTALREYDTVITSILKRHRLMKQLVLRAGFIDSGIRTYAGVYKNTLIESAYYIAKRG